MGWDMLPSIHLTLPAVGSEIQTLSKQNGALPESWLCGTPSTLSDAPASS